LHRRAWFAAATLLLLILVSLLQLASAVRSVVPLQLLTLTAVVLAGDLLLLRVTEERPEHLVLGLVVPINVILVVAISLLSLTPWYGIPAFVVVAVERPVVFVLCLVPVVARVMLVRSALQVHRLCMAAGRPRQWGAGLALSPALLVVGLSPALAVTYVNWHPSASAADVAVQAARAVQRCAQRYAADHGGRFPADLASLGPSGTGCLDASRASGRAPGWSVRLRGGDHLTVVVRERTLPFRAYRSYSSDASGVIRTAGYARRDATTSDAVIGNVTVELAQLHDCMLHLETSGAHRLPASLWAMSQWRSACYVLNSARWRVDGDSNVAEVRTRFNDGHATYDEVYRYSYLPSFGPDGRVDSATIAARPATYGVTGLRSYLLTTGGEIRATGQDRPATATDPSAAPCESYSLSGCKLTDMTWFTVKPLSDSAAAPKVAPAWRTALAPRPAGGSFWRPPPPTVMPDGAIVVMGQMGTFAYAANGTRRWTRPDIGVTQGGGVPGPGPRPDPTIVVVDSSGVVHALGRDGRDVWRAALGVRPRFAPVVLPGTIYVAGDHIVFALAPNGTVRWRRGLAGLTGDIAGARDGGIYADVTDDQHLLEHFTADGRLDATAPRDSLRPCAGDANLGSLDACYAGFRARLEGSGARRFALLPRQMSAFLRDELVWTWQLSGHDAAFVMSYGALFAIGADRGTLWRVPGGPASNESDGFTITPGGAVVLASGRGLAAYDGGGLVWTAHLNDEGWFSQPVVGRDGTIYVVDTNWMLYAVRPPQPSRSGGTP
jgi:putative pyrroloquinoline-quinone binding quinoprotein